MFKYKTNTLQDCIKREDCINCEKKGEAFTFAFLGIGQASVGTNYIQFYMPCSIKGKNLESVQRTATD